LLLLYACYITTRVVYYSLAVIPHLYLLHKQSSAISKVEEIILDATLKKIIKRQLPFLIGGTITGVIMTYYYGFLFSIIVNSAIWMLISFIVNKYYYKSTGFKDERYLLQYGLAMINSRTKRA
jgi:hypothetical protein